MVALFIVTLIILLFIQIITFVKVIRLVRQVSKMLLEIRLLFKNSGIYYVPNQNRVIKAMTCQYCRYRQTYIHISDHIDKENFYYVCKKHEKEISLSDGCEEFDRDFQSL